MTIYDYLVKQRMSDSNQDQLDCIREMYKTNRLTICLPTGGGKGHLMITDLLNRIVNTEESIFAIATHRLMLNTQHMTDILTDFLPLTGKIGYIFVGSIPYNTKPLQKIPDFNSLLYNQRIGFDKIISSVISSQQLNEKVEEHLSAGRKVVIITTYHSLMKLASLRIDTAYFDEAHILATNSQKEDAKFKENYEQVVSKNYFFFSATPKDLLGLREGENTDSFLMNNKSIFGERVGITFATAVAKAYIVEPVIHLLRPSDYVDGMEDFGSIADKVKFIQESFYAHRDYMRSKSADPSKLGVKILVKCSSVTEEMWPIFNLLKGSMPGVKICAGASVENTDGTYSQGKHCIDEHTINRRDDYLYSLQKLKPEEEAIILHFDILSEGINVAGFTGIMFLSGLMLTITKILQNIGRATRLHKLDRDRLRDKLISVSDYSKWIKPCCAVIIPYWNNTSEQTKRQMETIIHDLRYRYDFTARLELTLGDDRGISAGDPEIPENLLNEERERIRQALVDDIEQEIEGIRVGIYERYESNRIDNLSDEDWYNEVLSSL